MTRLFVAIRPPRLLRERLLALMGGVMGARWQSDEQLHVTLRFIGEVDRHCAADVAAALGSVHHAAFDLALDGIGHFDRKGRIESLWAGVGPHEPLKALHQKIDQALVRVGLPGEQRAYLPHLTLARFGRAGATGPVEPFLGRTAGLSSPPVRIVDFCLYESSLGRDGASYTIVERYPLEPAAR
ncbi:RNA 2',3'-cyclic phosphodiesterase [Sphingomonas oleivorans]|uniref:RNA 2',3'-cyclic phosphodiesterase n=1 Tax=Sphingomonas oleivorans TaxID=1735121 RepID=A0A2T5G030_9SPHN|nr:RNA 2',3'-cyclic phosphodiesterase [Sphingomonas oleivorans]PTQ12312.1 RNA 2',3'-cyclic phosphodiesterase [Sphingomonas oleivorans]